MERTGRWVLGRSCTAGDRSAVSAVSDCRAAHRLLLVQVDSAALSGLWRSW